MIRRMIEGFRGLRKISGWKGGIVSACGGIDVHEKDRRLLKSTTAANPRYSYDTSSRSAIDKTYLEYFDALSKETRINEMLVPSHHYAFGKPTNPPQTTPYIRQR